MQEDYSLVVKEKVRAFAEVFAKDNYQQTPSFRKGVAELTDLIIDAPINYPDKEYSDVNFGVGFKTVAGREILKTSLEYYILSSKNERPRKDSGLPEWYHGLCVAADLRQEGFDLVTVVGGIFHDSLENQVEKRVDELKALYSDRKLSRQYQTLCSYYAGKFARNITDRLGRTGVLDQKQIIYLVNSLLYINGKMIRTLFEKNYFADVKRIFNLGYDTFGVLPHYDGKVAERFELLNSYRAAAIKFADRDDNTAALTTLSVIKRMKNIYKNICLQQEFRFEQEEQDLSIIGPFINRVIRLDENLSANSYEEAKVMFEMVKYLIPPRTLNALVDRSIRLDREGWYNIFTEDGPSKNIYEQLIAGKLGIVDAFKNDPKLLIWSAMVLTHVARKFKQNNRFKLGGYGYEGLEFHTVKTHTKPIKIAI